MFLCRQTKLVYRWFKPLFSSFSSAKHTVKLIGVPSILISASGYREEAGDTLILEVVTARTERKKLFVDQWLLSTSTRFLMMPNNLKLHRCPFLWEDSYP